MDTNRDGRLSMAEFENLVRRRCGMAQNEAIPETLANTMQKALDDRQESASKEESDSKAEKTEYYLLLVMSSHILNLCMSIYILYIYTL